MKENARITGMVRHACVMCTRDRVRGHVLDQQLCTRAVLQSSQVKPEVVASGVCAETASMLCRFNTSLDKLRRTCQTLEICNSLEACNPTVSCTTKAVYESGGFQLSPGQCWVVEGFRCT